MLGIKRKTPNVSVESNDNSNIFIDPVVITFASDVTQSEQEAGFNHDAAVQIKVDYLSEDKADWSRTITIGGRFGRNESGEVEAWGGAFKLRDLFESASSDNTRDIIDDDGKIIDSEINDLVGKEIKILSYVSSKTGKAKVWNHVTNLRRSDDSYKSYFLRQVQDGWVKDFQDPNAGPQNGMVESNDLDGPWDDNKTQEFQQDFV